MFRCALLIAAAWALIETAAGLAAPDESPLLELHTRSRTLRDGSNDLFELVQGTVSWAPSKTALVVVDMWDDHWCQGAAKRVDELAGPMNKLISSSRDRGVLIVHCPRTFVDFYKDTPARRRVAGAPYAKPHIELATSERWGTA